MLFMIMIRYQAGMPASDEFNMRLRLRRATGAIARRSQPRLLQADFKRSVAKTAMPRRATKLICPVWQCRSVSALMAAHFHAGRNSRHAALLP